MRRPGAGLRERLGPWALALLLALPGTPALAASSTGAPRVLHAATGNDSAVGNFSSAIGRLVEIVAAAGAGLLALVWARVAISWFSNDVTKKVQAKDRARDALIGTLLFVGAISGLVWALAQWVVSGT
jgi:hypothetical protein